MTRGKRSLMIPFLRSVLNIVFLLLIVKLVGTFILVTIVFINPECPANMLSTNSIFRLIPTDHEPPYEITSSDPDYQLDLELIGWVTLKPTNRSYILIGSIIWYIINLLYLLVVFLLRKFFQTLQKVSPFVHKNAIRIRIMGWSIIGAEIIRNIYEHLAVYHLKSKTLIENAVLKYLNPEIYFSFLRLEIIFIGAVLLVIAEIFRLGARMKEEQELTI